MVRTHLEALQREWGLTFGGGGHESSGCKTSRSRSRHDDGTIEKWDKGLFGGWMDILLLVVERWTSSKKKGQEQDLKEPCCYSSNKYS